MVKPINHRLLFESICWVLYQYAQLTPEEQNQRPIREYRVGESKQVCELIATIRHAYQCQQRAYKFGQRQSKPVFEIMKKYVVESLSLQYRWDERTRNLYSSIASVYIAWEHNGQSVVNKRKLAVVVAYGKMFLLPNHRWEYGKQKVLALE